MSNSSTVLGPGSRSLSWPDAYPLKKAVVSASLAALGAAFELTSKWSPELRAELADWDEGLIFRMGILPKGPYMAVKKEGDGVRWLGAGPDDPTVSILFKSVDDALLSFTGQIGTHTAVIEKRFIVHGNLADGMRISRALNLVQLYLMPLALIRHTYKRPPSLTGAQLLVKARVMAALAPRLAAASHH